GAKRDYGTGDTPLVVAIGDLDGNRSPDLVIANSTENSHGNTVSVLLNQGSGGPSTYVIEASNQPHGSISPSGSVIVPAGGSQTFTIAAENCFEIGDVVVDGSSVGAVTSYTFSNVTANHTIAA